MAAAVAEAGSLAAALPDAGSLAAALPDAAGGTPADAGGPAGAGVDPAGQVPHWLFAFDAVRITAMRTLALLGSDPARRAAGAADVAPVLPYLRACVPARPCVPAATSCC